MNMSMETASLLKHQVAIRGTAALICHIDGFKLHFGPRISHSC